MPDANTQPVHLALTPTGSRTTAAPARQLALVVLRTTGPDPSADDLTEVAVARLDPVESRPTDLFTFRVLPANRPLAPGAVTDGLPLTKALQRIRSATRGCVFAGFQAHAARAFLDGLCAFWGVPELEFAPDTLDVGSLAWPLVVQGRASGMQLAELCAAFGIREPPHSTALETLVCTGELYRELLAESKERTILANLEGDERDIVRTIAQRIDGGRSGYGVWNVNDGRDNLREGVAEALDAAAYLAAELLRLSRVARGGLA